MVTIGEAGLLGEFRNTLRHRAWCAQRHVHITIQAVSEPTCDHRTAVAHSDVIRM
jgi:hypothetical protein